MARMPESLEQLSRHRMVLLDRPIAHHVFSRVFPGVAQDDLVRLRTNNSVAQLSIVLNGGGFAWIPTYVDALIPSLLVVPIDLVFSSNVWLARRTGVASAHLDDLWRWIVSRFDGEKFPWFCDQYIPPERFDDRHVQMPLPLVRI